MHSVKTSQPILENLETRQRPEVKEQSFTYPADFLRSLPPAAAP